MFILKVRAFGDFDVSYDIDLAVFEEKEKSDESCKVLNEFCRSLDGCNQDIKLSKYLVHSNWVEKLKKALEENTEMCDSQISSLVQILVSLCKENSIYIYPDIFFVNTIMGIV